MFQPSFKLSALMIVLQNYTST